MDVDKLISRDKFGSFCVLFKNRDSLTEDEIRELFSQYGNVINIRCTGDSKGFRFIRYKFEDEARKAIEGLRDSASIKFAVPKERNQTENSNFSKNHPGNGTEESGGNWHANKNEFSKSKKNFYQNKNSNYQKNFHKKNSYQTKNYNGKEDTESVKSDSSWNYDEKDQSSEKLTVEIETNKPVKNNKESISTKSPVTEINFKEEIPPLVIKNKKAAPQAKVPKNVIADEVIVGNIHPEISAPYILHLFDHFEPIAISKMNMIPHTNIRYCQVYFKSAKDSVLVETQFDKKEVSGQKLVVLRACRLLEEAT